MDIDDIREFETDEGFKAISDSRKYITRYVDFENAKALGITFRPQDIKSEDFRAFCIIKVKLMELEEKRHGGKGSNRINPRAKKGARRSR